MGFKDKYGKLFEEGKIGSIIIPNRLVMAPMGVGNFGEFFEERLINFYGARARGGIGLVLTENNYVSSIEEDTYPRFLPVPRFDDKRKLSRAASIATRIKMYGGVPGIQLGAGQGRNSEDVLPDDPPMSSSPIPALRNPSVICREMTQEDIDKKVAAFERAARLAVDAGFQYIEVHAHTGYLLEQFLNKKINARTDKYGGSAENRFRFAKEIVEAMKGAIGDKAAIGIRMSVDHKVHDGITLDEGLEYCKLAEAAGYDALHIDAGSGMTQYWAIPAPYLGVTPLKQYAKAVKEVVNIPVITVGGFLMPEEAEAALEEGDADFVAVGRALLADPDWANKAKQGREDEIRGCVGCSMMCADHCSTSKVVTCAVNPPCGREKEFTFEKVDEPKRVTIVGGGAAGMVTALVAARRGHKVKVLEKSGELGGNMNLISLEKCKRGVRNYNNYIKNQMIKKGIDVTYNCEATIETIRATEPDAVVVATGSYMFVPNIPGFDGEDVVTIRQLYEERELKGDEKIVVIGGGVNGCEVALAMAEEGHKVTVVELQETFANGLGAFNKLSLLSTIKENENITMLNKTKCLCIEDHVLKCEDAEGNPVEFDFDLAIACIGMKSENALGKEVLAEFPEAYMIGDAISHQRIGDAVHQGFFTGMRL